MTGSLRVPRRAALAAIAALVAAASLVSFAESYRGLWLWAHEHGLRAMVPGVRLPGGHRAGGDNFRVFNSVLDVGRSALDAS